MKRIASAVMVAALLAVGPVAVAPDADASSWGCGRPC
jgi:hypothetical protein